MRDETDWNVTTFEGNRRLQHREFLALPFRRKLEIIEQLADVAQAFSHSRGAARPGHAPVEVRETAPAYSAAGSKWALDQGVLDEIVRRVVEVAQPDRIILFGSAARGAMGPDSDIDLLVIKSGVEHRRRLEGDIYMNLFGVGVPVDVIVVTPEDIVRSGHRTGSVIRPALREGRQIYAA